MRYIPIKSGFFSENRRRLSKLLEPRSVAIFNANDEYLRNGDQRFIYRQQSDFFYLTGIEQEKSVLMLAPDYPDPKLREILWVLRTSEQMAIREGHKVTREEAHAISGIKNVQWLDNLEMTLRDLILWSDHIYLNTYEYPKFSSEVESRDLRFAHSLIRQYPVHKYLRAAPLMTKLRMIKTDTEVDLIRKANEITGKAFRRMLRFVKPGVYEFEIQAEMEHEFLINRANGSAFPPIIATGKNACVLHYHQNNSQCADGNLVLFDFGAEYANYAADVSRTIPVNGKFTPRQKQLYELVHRVQKLAVQQMIPGNTMENYNSFVNQEMEKEMIKMGLLDKQEVKNQNPENPLFKKYFMHGTAHHLGLDVHDVIHRFEPFQSGMVFTCEPGIYIPQEGIGIRLENDILISENGPVDLSADIPVELNEIEQLMTQQ
ncbi:MAG TPA: aminopeptidase P family protein [Bacteroidales bacterium]|nr:aminopeptidase P family protein [Bacteroidales bacterium]